jgi:hypothetical protein
MSNKKTNNKTPNKQSERQVIECPPDPYILMLALSRGR